MAKLRSPLVAIDNGGPASAMQDAVTATADGHESVQRGRHDLVFLVTERVEMMHFEAMQPSAGEQCREVPLTRGADTPARKPAPRPAVRQRDAETSRRCASLPAASWASGAGVRRRSRRGGRRRRRRSALQGQQATGAPDASRRLGGTTTPSRTRTTSTRVVGVRVAISSTADQGMRSCTRHSAERRSGRSGSSGV